MKWPVDIILIKTMSAKIKEKMISSERKWIDKSFELTT